MIGDTQVKFTLFRKTDVPRVEKDIADDILSGAPRQHSQLLFASDKETIKSGIWESTAGSFRAVMQDQIEFCHIIEGGATIRTEHGETFASASATLS